MGHDSLPALAGAVEDNIIAFNLLPVHGACGELHDEPELLWFTTGLPYPVFNGVLRARFRAGTTGARIEDVLARFRRSDLPLTWYVGPSSQPAGLGERLRAHGLACSAHMPGMTIDLGRPRPEGSPPPGLVITRVEDAAALLAWLRPVSDGFDFMPDLASATYGLYAGMGLGPERPLQHYVGWLDGDVVGAGSLYQTGETAGLYCIATLSSYRRRGIGTAMTLALLAAAQARGCRLAVLYATALGVEIYRRIGFDTQCHLTYFTWPPYQQGWFDEGCGE